LKELRASSLPKLAECPLFEGSQGTSEAASRGTKMDEAYRAWIGGKSVPPLLLEEKNAVAWAVAESESLASGGHIETDEAHLAMHVPGLSATGTADALCIAHCWLADLKTGQIRNYREQMAAYALACMEAHFSDTWTAHVLYCDHAVRRSYEFTRDEAERIVRQVIADAVSPDAQPAPCEYCDWCARKDSCTAIVTHSKAAVALATSSESLTAIRDRILSSPDTIAEFARQWKQAEKDIAEPVLEKLKELAAEDKAPGWKLVQVSGREFVEADAITTTAQTANLSTASVVLAMGGKMSGKQFREWCATIGATVDDTAIKRGEPTTQLRQQKQKK
jgi:phosphoglycolate phosphatase-like HAD superfamily hydrolase